MSAPEPADQLPAGMPQPGTVFVGKYRIDKVLGIGGMGVVYGAFHMHLEESVALKLIRPECVEPEFVARFLREGRAVVKIKSEHVARVLDVGEDERGQPYLVMEHLRGHDLGSVVGALPFPMAVDYVVQACDALAHAHGLGIVHRDIKPSNLFASTELDGTCVKVLDFGIAKAPVVEGAPGNFALTRTGGTMGSPLYMSPEQIRSLKEVDQRADIWSLGVVLFELVTGRMPFDGHSLAALAASIMVDEPLAMRTTRPEVPPGLDAVVARCLEKKAEKRFANVAELAQALAPFGEARTNARVERIVRIAAASSDRMRAASMAPSSMPMQVGAPAVVSAATVPALNLAATAEGPQHQTSRAWGGAKPSGGGNRRTLLIAAFLTFATLAVIGIAFSISAMRARAEKHDPFAAAASDVPRTTSAASSEAPATTSASIPAAPVASASASASASVTAATSAPASSPVRKVGPPPAVRGPEPVAPATAPTTSSGLVRNRHGS